MPYQFPSIKKPVNGLRKAPVGTEPLYKLPKPPNEPAAPAPPPPNPSAGVPGSSFVNFDRVLGANYGTAQKMATQTAQGLAARAAQADKARDTVNNRWSDYFNEQVAQNGAIDKDLTGMEGYEDADLAEMKANEALDATKSAEGVQSLMQTQYGGTGYGQGASALDAALTGATGGGQFAQARQRFSRLDDALGKAGQTAADDTTGYNDWKNEAEKRWAEADQKIQDDATEMETGPKMRALQRDLAVATERFNKLKSLGFGTYARGTMEFKQYLDAYDRMARFQEAVDNTLREAESLRKKKAPRDTYTGHGVRNVQQQDQTHHGDVLLTR